MKANKVFITTEFYDQSIDYPQNVPLPTIGNMVMINGRGGRVEDIRHIIQDDLITIKIIMNQKS